MKAKTKKVKTPSRLDKLEIELTNYRVQVRDLRSEISSLMQRADKVDTRINREVAALREQFQLTEEYRSRAFKAETALASLPDAAPTQNEKYWTSRLENEQAKFEALEKSYEYAQKTLDQFKSEDEARAFAIREIVRPFGFDLFAPMDAVRELAKMVFSQRDQIEGGKATEALLRETIKKMALLKAPPPPDCPCVRYTDSETPLTDSVVGEIVLYGTWEGRTAIAMRKCAACGGTGRKQKSRLDESPPSPPDARQSATSRLDVGQFRATEGELKEALKLWHEGKVCTCSGGQQYHRVENSECYYEPRSEGKQANPSPPNTAQSAEVKVKTPFMFSEAKMRQDREDAEVARMAAQEVEAYCVCVRFPREGPVAEYDPETETLVDRCYYGHVVLAQKGCRHCGGTGYRRKAFSSPHSEVGGSPRSEGEAVPNCPCTECSLKREKASGKPIRLLVEIVPKKDEKHGIWRHMFHSGVEIGVFRPGSTDHPSVSVQELKPMPPLADLPEIFRYARDRWIEAGNPLNGTREGIRAVLAACGLEVE